MFYISDVNDAIRELLNDKETPYRFGNELILEYVVEAFREIHRLRPDTRIDSSGDLQYINALYTYTDTQTYMSNYQHIIGWDKYANVALYFKMTSSSVCTIYPSATDRTNDTNSLATIANCDSTGVKVVTEANDSGFNGRVTIDSVAPDTTTWDVSVVEAQIDMDDIFISPVIDFVVARCFDIDSEDLADRQLAEKHYAKFMRGIK
jgi:hypothetical protein